MLIGKPFSGAPHAALDLVGDQQGIVLARQLVRRLNKLFAHRTNTTLALHKLKANGADGRIEFAFEIGDVIEADKLHSWHHGREWKTIFFLVRSRHGAKRSAVKSMLQGKNLVG